MRSSGALFRLARLDLAYEKALVAQDTQATFAVIASALATILEESRDFRQFDLWLWRLERACRRHGDDAARSLAPDLQCAILFAMTFRQPRHPRLRNWVLRLEKLLADPAQAAHQAGIAHALLVHHLWAGDLHATVPLLVHLAQLSERESTDTPSDPPFAALFLYVGRAVHRFLDGRDAECLDACTHGLNLAAAAGGGAWASHLAGFAAAARLAAGGAAEARQRLEAMAEHLAPSRCFDRALYHMLCTWQELEYGCGTASARSHARANLKISEALGATVPLFCAVHQQALLATAEGRYHEARRWQQRTRSLAAHWRNPLLAFMCELSEAWLALHGGDEAQAARSLRNAFRLARRNDYKGAWHWPRGMLSRLCAEALVRDIETGHVRSIVLRRRLPAPVEPALQSRWPWPVRIFTLGRFGILVDGRPLDHGRKTPQMPLNLLRVLIALGGRGMSRERVMELLWPDAEGDRAASTLSVTLARLRRLLACPEAVEASDHRLRLDPRYCWVDAWAFERGLGHPVREPETAITTLEAALAHYQGPFLEEVDTPWAILMRERLARHFVEAVGRLCRLHERRRDWAAAAAGYLRGLNAAPLRETFHERRIRCLLRLRRQGEALEALQGCDRIFHAHGLPPPAWRTELLSRIRSGR